MNSQAAAVLEHAPDACEDDAHEHVLAPEYLAFMRRQVDAARADIAAGRLIAHEQIEAEHAAWCARVLAGHE